MDIQIAFGRSIRKLREQKRLSQEALGDLLYQPHRRAVQNVGLKTIQKLGWALKASPRRFVKEFTKLF